MSSLKDLEIASYNHKHEEASVALNDILFSIRRGGYFISGKSCQLDANEYCAIATRFSSAITALMADKEFKLSDSGYKRLAQYKSEITTLFAISGFGNQYTLMDMFFDRDGSGNLFITGEVNLRKYFLTASLESIKQELIDSLPSLPTDISFPFIIGALATNYILTPEAESVRNKLLWAWKDMRNVTVSEEDLLVISVAWMQCSYANLREKHYIKHWLNRQIMNWLEQNDLKGRPVAHKPEKARPVVAVLSERYSSVHAMYRCYSRSINDLKKHFKVILVTDVRAVDDVAEQGFDDVISLDLTTLKIKDIVNKVNKLQPDIIFYPSLGMHHWTVVLANMRLAPVQIMCMGHPATSLSDFIDYMITEEGYITDKTLYSEKIVTVRNGGTPLAMRHDVMDIAPNIRRNPDIVNIAIAASSMKINSLFIEACNRIRERSSKRINLVFFPNTSGVNHVHFSNQLSALVPGSIVRPRTDYNQYLEWLNECDIMLSPFPFGGTNSNIDAARLGIPIVHMDGPELHQHVDCEMMRRMGQPSWLTAASIDEYIANALRLIENDTERTSIGNDLASKDILSLINSSVEIEFAKCVRLLYDHHQRIQEIGNPYWHITDLEAVSQANVA